MGRNFHVANGEKKRLKGNSDPADPDSYLEVFAPFLSSLAQGFPIKSHQKLLSSAPLFYPDLLQLAGKWSQNPISLFSPLSSKRAFWHPRANSARTQGHRWVGWAGIISEGIRSSINSSSSVFGTHKGKFRQECEECAVSGTMVFHTR